MLNKGTLMAEEVKGQFSESISGGLSIFARALGVTEKEFLKLMEQGKLMSAEVLPKVADEMARVAREGGALDIKMQSNRAAMNRMRTAFQNLQNAFFRSGFREITTQTFEFLTNTMRGLIPIVNILGNTISTAFTIATAPIRLLAAAVFDLFTLLDITGESTFTQVLGWFVGLTVGIVALYKQVAILKGAFTGMQALFAGASFLGALTAVKTKFAAIAASMGLASATPLLIIGGIAAAIGAIAYFWDDIKKMATEAWTYISKLFGLDASPSVSVATGSTTAAGSWTDQIAQGTGAAIAAGTAQAVNVNNKVAVEIGLNSDMLEGKIREGANASMSSLQTDLQAASSF